MRLIADIGLHSFVCSLIDEWSVTDKQGLTLGALLGLGGSYGFFLLCGADIY